MQDSAPNSKMTQSVLPSDDEEDQELIRLLSSPPTFPPTSPTRPPYSLSSPPPLKRRGIVKPSSARRREEKSERKTFRTGLSTLPDPMVIETRFRAKDSYGDLDWMKRQTTWKEDSFFLVYGTVEAFVSPSTESNPLSFLVPIKYKESEFSSLSQAKPFLDSALDRVSSLLSERRREGTPIHRLYFSEEGREGVLEEVDSYLVRQIKSLSFRPVFPPALRRG